VSPGTNARLYDLLVAFKARTGYGVLCNTSLNFSGKGFINNLTDLDTCTVDRELDGFVVEGRAYLLQSSERYKIVLEGREPVTMRRDPKKLPAEGVVPLACQMLRRGLGLPASIAWEVRDER
jgi:hypothetical protein